MSQVREAVAVFTASQDMEAAIDALLSSGFSRPDISLLASHEAVEAKLGHMFTSTRELEDLPNVPSSAYIARESIGDAEGAVVGGLMYVGAFLGIGSVLVSGGAIGAAIAAAVLAGGGGAAIGGVLAHFIGKHHADYLQDQLDSGGILLWVRTRDAAHEESARKILAEHSGQDVHVHGMPASHPELERAASQPGKGDERRHEIKDIHGVQVSIAADGVCFALGRVFSSEFEANRYIEETQMED